MKLGFLFFFKLLLAIDVKPSPDNMPRITDVVALEPTNLPGNFPTAIVINPTKSTSTILTTSTQTTKTMTQTTNTMTNTNTNSQTTPSAAFLPNINSLSWLLVFLLKTLI
ncbi:hypothetical protein BC833DRAFT_610062 [Globomyces pollinis-pini]|nr:hypothetical protein BC833DRAFT_610062 [Globomyces pollinis-pini]